KYILAVIVFFAIIAGGVFVWQKGLLISSGTKISERTKDWETYRNEEYKYEVKYPESWQRQVLDSVYADAISTKNDVRFYPSWVNLQYLNIKDPMIGVNVLANTERAPLPVALHFTESISCKDVKVGGIRFCRYAVDTEAPTDLTVYALSRGDWIYTIGIMCDLSECVSSEEYKIFEDVLSTFRFLTLEELTKPYIQVISPNGGGVWRIGRTYQIKYRTQQINEAGVAIFLVDQSASPWKLINIAKNTSPTLGQLSYRLSSDISPGTKYKILVTGVVASASEPYQGSVGLSDESDDYFTIEKDATSDWKIYRSTLGFEIKYPNTLYINLSATLENQDSMAIFEETKYRDEEPRHWPSISITEIITTLTPREWVVKNAVNTIQQVDDERTQIEDVVIGLDNIPTIKFYSEKGSSGSTHTIIKAKGDWLLDISLNSNPNGEISREIYDKVLSTFRFSE
ncbi:MAG: hypothetical protein HYS60_01735, partial [Candidatus Wildermuthbacteria bacterium]|nr:hypothetical protein [Candidatus Wildermuthbacteria bacterium]